MTRSTAVTASASTVNRAGEVLRRWWQSAALASQEVEDALATVSAFRAGFQTPLTSVVMSLRSFMHSEGVDTLVGQRLKRMPTILDKLTRIPEMKLARMQDIGGCRAVVPEGAFGSIEAVRRRFDRSRTNEVVRVYDYIAEPKPTGYRAVHVIVRRADHLIEVQLRTARQHAWAEFVESLGARTRHNLKDGQGPEELLAYLRVGAYLVAMQEQDEVPGESLLEEFVELSTIVQPYLAGHP
jgi:putative GTP pyrophosphokinase